MQARIQQARREAETLKDKIKRKKDELADTTRTFTRSDFNVMACTPLLSLFRAVLLIDAGVQSGPLLNKPMSQSPRTS